MYNLEDLISQTYGQSGFRKILFLMGFNRYLRDLTITGYQKTEKLDFEKFDKVPLPETFVEHINQKVLKNSKILNSPKISQFYNNLL